LISPHPGQRCFRLTITALLALLLNGCGGLFDDTPSLSQQQLLDKLQQADRPLLLDVRSAKEFRSGHIPGAVNIDIRGLSGGLARLGAYRYNEVVVYCETGSRARHAIPLLKDAGFTHLLLADGDMSGWRRARLPAQRGQGEPVFPQPAPEPAPEPAQATAGQANRQAPSN